MVQITKTNKGIITELKVGDNTFTVGDDTHMGKIKSFFSSGDVVWVSMESGSHYQARILHSPKGLK